MPVVTEQITVSTEDEAVHNITGQVQAVIDESGIQHGQCLVHCMHTTAGIMINEDDAPLYDDFFERVLTLVPPGAGYAHNESHQDDNAHAHIVTGIIGRQCTVPVADDTLALGAYQDILLVEMDGPQERTVTVQVRGEEG